MFLLNILFVLGSSKTTEAASSSQEDSAASSQDEAASSSTDEPAAKRVKLDSTSDEKKE